MDFNYSVASTGILIINKKNVIVSANNHAHLIFGYTDRELINIPITLLLRDFLFPSLMSSEKDRWPETEGKQHQTIGTSKNGIELAVNINCSNFSGEHEVFTVVAVTPTVHEAGKPLTRELVDSTAHVESLSKKFQLQLLERKGIEQKLIKIQRMYDAVVHHFPNGVIGVLDREMKYLLLDGGDLDKINLHVIGLNGVPHAGKDDRKLAEDTLRKIKRAFHGENVSFEARAVDDVYHISAVPLPDLENKINEILCVLINVTDRHRLEEGLVSALEKEKELSELKSRFVTMACHEFRTPLATILSSAFLLEKYMGEDYAKEKMVHTSRIRRSVNNLTMILNDFLMLDRSQQKQVVAQNIPIELNAFVGELITELDTMKKTGQTILYRHTGDQQVVHLDPHLLWSIITNLISNGLKYSREGSVIELTSAVADDEVTISVKDTGIGIPEEEHKHIFGRFYRARNAQNIEGTGLGLYIVEKHVRLLNGTIGFTSKLNVGTVFTTKLPNGLLPAMITEP